MPAGVIAAPRLALCALLLIALFAAGCVKRVDPLIGRWVEEGLGVTEFRADGTLIAADGTSSKWEARHGQLPTSGTLSLIYGDITMEFNYSIIDDSLMLSPVALAGETALNEEVAHPVVLRRVVE